MPAKMVSRCGALGLALICASGMAPIAQASELPLVLIAAPEIDEEATVEAIVAKAIRAAGKPSAQPGFPYRLHTLDLVDIYFPGDRDPASGLPRIADRPREALQVEQWILAQVPDNIQPMTEESKIEVLYLPACRASWATWVPLDTGGEGSPDSTVVERAWLKVFLEESGLGGIAIPRFTQRVARNDRADGPDSQFRALNATIAARTNADLSLPVTLVLEQYCGREPERPRFPGQAVPPPPYPPPPPPPPHAVSQYYRVALPAGLTAAMAAPMMWADVCASRKSSKFVTAGCRGWSPLSPGMPGATGRFRLVGKIDGAWRSFTYTVLPTNLSEDHSAPTVPVQAE